MTGKLRNGLIQLRDARRPLRRRGVLGAVCEVGSDGVAEQEALLRNESDLPPQFGGRDVARRHAIDEDLSLLRIVNARNEVDQRALPTSRRADDSKRGSGRDAEADVAQYPARLARRVGRVVKAHVSKLDRAARHRRRQMLHGFFAADGRTDVENLVQPPHRSLTALKQVHHPAKGDHRPGQHREIHAERDEGAHRDSAPDREHAAQPQNHHCAEPAEERKEWIERSPEAHQRHVEREVFVVDLSEAGNLRPFLAIRANDARAAQILLRTGRERGEMLLHRLEAVVNSLAHTDRERRKHQQRQQRQQGQLDVDPQHENEREKSAGDRIGEIHHRRANGHPDGAQVVRQARHDVAGAGVCKVGRVERLQMYEQVIPEVVLDPAAHAVYELAHSVPEGATDDGGEHDQAAELPDGSHRCAITDGVDRSTQKPRDYARDCGGRDHDRKTDGKRDPVRPVVWRRKAKILQIWHVDCRLRYS